MYRARIESMTLYLSHGRDASARGWDQPTPLDPPCDR
jgi:hypothetical protein